MGSSKSDVNWMYEGPQSLVNREDYLVGRKIDRNFELFNSDFKEAPSKIEYLTSKTSKSVQHKEEDVREKKTTMLLNIDTIKKEDPLVAIKVQEEKIRREILDNPLKMKRLQNIVMSAMEEKMKSMIEHQQSVSNQRQRHRSSSSSSPDRKKSRKRPDSREERRKRDKSSKRREKYSPDRRVDRRRHGRNSEDSSNAGRWKNEESQTTRRKKDEESKKRRKSSSSRSSTERLTPVNKKERPLMPGYGLIYVNEASKPSTSRPVGKEDNSSSSGSKRHSTTVNVKQRQASPPKEKRRLTEAEKEEKRREMMQNASWREEQRHRNLKEAQKMDEAEKRADDRTKAATFVRPMLSAAVDESSVEARIKSKRHTIQRRHNAMDSNFARK